MFSTVSAEAPVTGEPQSTLNLSSERTFDDSRVILQSADLSWAEIAALLDSSGARNVRSVSGWDDTFIASFAGPESARDAAAAVRDTPGVDWAEVDGVARYTIELNDPLYADQLWAQSIDLPGAWSVTQGRSSVVVAVVDSGVSRSHPDLQGKLLQGRDFLDNDNDPEDDIGHGTAVAGIVAASGNDGVGIARVALNARILPVRVGSIEGAPISILAQGIIWAVDQGADVINLSLVADQTSMALQDALQYAYNNDVPVVTAAGNEQDAVTYPGAYEESISVGASTFWGSVTEFSTRQNRVDLIAPGASILAPWWSPSEGNTWATVTGTSFAAPMVSGTIALLLSIAPDLTIDEIRSLLHETALPVSGDTPVPGAGAGQLDAGASLRTLLARSFAATWTPADLPVAEQLVGRTWLWGPSDFATGFEPYVEAPNGSRLVRYYDKSRMEITDPLDDRSASWYVTNGLLARELISGQMQTGDTAFEFRGSALIAVAGDPDDVLAPTYSDLKGLLGAEPVEDGTLIDETVDGAGRVRDDAALADYGVYAAQFVPETDHEIASVFWDYLNSQGLVYRNDELVLGRLFDPVYFATGFPITEAYWSRVLVGGARVDVLIQCFERRCLTYTPSNAPEWRVEMGNVGLHYYRWRYEDNAGPPPRVGNSETEF
ncbi:MAG: S8 family serine peptidase [Thermomicrobiales bacterium]